MNPKDVLCFFGLIDLVYDSELAGLRLSVFASRRGVLELTFLPNERYLGSCGDRGSNSNLMDERRPPSPLDYLDPLTILLYEFKDTTC